MYKVTIAVCLLGVASALRPLLGAGRQVGVDDPVANAIAHYAVSSHSEPTIRSGYFDTFDQILATTRQTAGGELYSFELKVKPSTCAFGEQSTYDASKCHVASDATAAETKTCTAKVHIRVWMKPSNNVVAWNCQ